MCMCPGDDEIHSEFQLIDSFPTNNKNHSTELEQKVVFAPPPQGLNEIIN